MLIRPRPVLGPDPEAECRLLGRGKDSPLVAAILSCVAMVDDQRGRTQDEGIQCMFILFERKSNLCAAAC